VADFAVVPPRPVAVVATTLEGAVTLWSSGAETLFELPASDAIGAPLSRLIGWHSLPVCTDTYGALGLDDVYVYHNEVTTPTGRNFRIKSTTTLSRDNDGTEEFLTVFTAPDAGAEWPGSPGFIRRLLSNRLDATLFCGRDGTVEYAASGIHRLLGNRPREAVGRNMGTYVHRDDREMCRRQWESALANPAQPYAVTARIHRADGELRWVEFTMTNLFDDPAVAAVAVGLHDVSDYHEAAELLSATEQTLRSVLGSSVEGVWIIEPNGKTVFANARMAELLEVKFAELVGDPVDAVLDPAVFRTIRSHIGERPAGLREEYELPFTRRDGRVRWLRMAVVPSYDVRGSFNASIMLCADVTDVRHQMPELALSRELIWRSDSGSRSPRLAGRGLPDRENTATVDLDKLSPREFDIVVRLLNGDRVPVIAATLFVSQSTIRNQLSSVFRKLRVRSQQELIALLREAPN
jgi:PAS domain S-box-containing protein